MGGVVKAMESAMRSMNLEKVSVLQLMQDVNVYYIVVVIVLLLML